MALSVEDQLAIQQLYARYNHAIDSGKHQDWAACFTSDGTFIGGGGNFTGTDQLVAFAQGFSARIKARHWTNNLVLEGDGKTATGTCYLQLLNLADAAKPGILTTGIYNDALEKADGAWRFTKRVVIPDAS